MSENTTLRAFPSSTVQALAFLYVQSQDLTGKTPEEISDMYNDAYERIQKHNPSNEKKYTF